jgi:hypothetical protein
MGDEQTPIPMLIWCPLCGSRHIDRGEYATKSHATHACQRCGLCFRPAIVPTVGVQFLPGFKDPTEWPKDDPSVTAALEALQKKLSDAVAKAETPAELQQLERPKFDPQGYEIRDRPQAWRIEEIRTNAAADVAHGRGVGLPWTKDRADLLAEIDALTEVLLGRRREIWSPIGTARRFLELKGVLHAYAEHHGPCANHHRDDCPEGGAGCGACRIDDAVNAVLKT